MDVRFRPYTWVGERTPPGKKRRAPYSSTWRQTLEKLEDELRKLRASEIIIEAGFDEDDIRLDGWPRANAKPPAYHGVKVSFNQPGVGRVEYPCDSCQHWQDNVHSIALGLSALRAVERYGITGRLQQYTGFRALGSGSMSRRQAAEWIAEQVYDRDSSTSYWAHAVQSLMDQSNGHEKTIRAATLKVHPDQNGGDRTKWDRFEEAKKVLTP